MENLYNDNAVRHGFFKINPILIIVLMAIFIPVSVLTSICYFQTKMNNNLPSFFSSIVITSDAKFEDEKISVGDKILIKKQSKELAEQIGQLNLDNKVLVAYFDAVEEESENGSPVRMGYLQYFGKNADDQWVYGFVGNEKLIISDAIIGVYQTNSSGKIGLTSFASSNLGLVLFSLLPLGIIFVLLILDIFEQKRIKETNQEIQWTLHPEAKTEKQENKDLGKEKVEKDMQKQPESQKPVQHAKPVEPQKSAQPEKIIEAQKQHAEPALTQAPAQQAKPIPQKPAVANAPAKPVQDAKVQTPAQQAKTVQPAKSDTVSHKPNAVPQKPSAPQQKTDAAPAKPNAVPQKPTAPAKPNAPAKPTAPAKPNVAPQRPANLPPKK